MKPLQKIEKLIPVLPKKDSELAIKFLKDRKFENILELVESNLYKLEKANKGDSEIYVDDIILTLGELKEELINYMPYPIEDNQEYYDYYV